MSVLNNKIDFAVIFRVKNANPNGDPLNGNRPRICFDGRGEVTDVAIKRKMRDRLLENGHDIFVQSDDRKKDDAKSLAERAVDILGKEKFGKKADREDTARAACEQWFDVRAFGQLFAFGKNSGADGVSIGIRGPVTVQSAFSRDRIDITSVQITKSVSGEGDGSKRSADTMGMKHRVDHGIYTFFGSINPQLAERTGFSDQDAEAIKQVLPGLFENDESSARPAGSMEVLKVFWWKHNTKSGQYSAAKVHGSLSINGDGGYELSPLSGLKPEVLDGR